KADAAYGRKHGCQLPPELSKRWPLGIDRIVDLWKSNADGRLLAFLCSIAKDYEPRNNLCQYLLVGPRAYHVLHPKNVEALLSTNFKGMLTCYYGFGCRPGVFAPLLGNGIFTQEGAAWKRSRELLRKQFVRIQYQNLECFDEHVSNLVSCLSSGGTIDLQPLFFNLTMDVATALLFGRSIYSLRAGIDQGAENKKFAEDFNIAQEGLAKRFRLAPFHFVYNPKSFRKACRSVHAFVENYIREAGLMKDELSDKREDDGGASWFIRQVAQQSATEIELRDQLLNVLLAGRDTTACCLSWTFRLLVRHPQAMERLRREVAAVMGEQTTATREQIRKMPFLACVVKESLRLYPPVPLNNREAIRTTILPTGGGPDGTSPIMVRKGELVVFSQYVNTRMKSLFGEDAYNFRPERWETGELDDVGWGYFPFNGGPRQCLGEDFALMEISYTIIRLLQTFPVIVLPEGEKIEPVGTERQTLTLVLSSADATSSSIPADGKSAAHTAPSRDVKAYGIKELYRPVHTEPQLDIVAVHGLNGDALRTWTAKERKSSWLSDPEFLPRHVPHARVLTWGYNASFSSIVGDTPSQDRIHHHAHTLVANLAADRRALSYAQTRTGHKVSHDYSIFSCTYGILFFGTPHHGSEKAAWLSYLMKTGALAGMTRSSSGKSDLVSALHYESETLQNITDYFVPIMRHFRIYYFWEQRKTDLKILGHDYIVSQESAAPTHDETERAGIDADHSGMVKFEDPSGQGFRMAADALLRYATEAPAAIGRRREEADKTLLQSRASEVTARLAEISKTKTSQVSDDQFGSWDLTRAMTSLGCSPVGSIRGDIGRGALESPMKKPGIFRNARTFDSHSSTIVEE
ncbi:Cytochrome P450, partial [Naviculisporaceae sp. PSN 640]